MSNIHTKKVNERVNIYWSNGKYLGYCYTEVDGFYVFVMDEYNGGAWDAYVLREIADALDALNKDWSAQIDEYFKQQKENGKTI